MQYEVLENKTEVTNQETVKNIIQLLIKREITTVITGNCDSELLKFFESKNIQVITGFQGNILQAVEHFIEKSIKPLAQPFIESHFGLNHFSNTDFFYEEDEDNRELVY